jgi:hypothetical protein
VQAGFGWASTFKDKTHHQAMLAPEDNFDRALKDPYVPPSCRSSSALAAYNCQDREQDTEGEGIGSQEDDEDQEDEEAEVNKDEDMEVL